MPRYIDADAFIKEQCNSCDGYCEKVDCDCLSCDKPYQCSVIQDLKNAPTVSPDEVRGVVHCGECKFWRRPPSCEGLARCETGETGIRYRSKNDFCSRGAKMEVSEDA